MKIILMCNAGMSTGILQLKIQDEAKARGLDAEVVAIPLTEFDEQIKTADAVLLGPQIKFAEKDVRKHVNEGTPVMVISAQDFGLMKAGAILEQLLVLMK